MWKKKTHLHYSEVAAYELRLACASLLLETAVRLLYPLSHFFHLALLRVFRLGLHLPLLPALLPPLSISARPLPPLLVLAILFLALFSAGTRNVASPGTATAAAAAAAFSGSVSAGGGLPRPRLGLPLVLETPRLGNLGEVWRRVRDVSESVLGQRARGWYVPVSQAFVVCGKATARSDGREVFPATAERKR